MVVCLFDAVEQGAAQERHASRILGNVGMASDPPDRHREVHVYRVGRAPRAAYLHVRAWSYRSVYRFAVYLDRCTLLAPGRDAEHQGELTLASDLDLYPPIPRVAGVLAEHDGPAPV